MEVEVQEGLDLAGSSGPQGCGWWIVGLSGCGVLELFLVLISSLDMHVVTVNVTWRRIYADRILIK
jgi:hypothetical protein